MATWKKVFVVGLAVLAGVVPALAQQVDLRTTPTQQATVPLPQGQELSDEELLKVDGECDPLTVVAAAVVGAGLGAAGDLVVQGVEIALGKRTTIDWKDVGKGAAVGAVTGPVAGPLTRVVRSAIVTGARWVARATAATASAAASFASRAYQALHTVHETLHRYVSVPVRNFFSSAWDWIRGRR